MRGEGHFTHYIVSVVIIWKIRKKSGGKLISRHETIQALDLVVNTRAMWNIVRSC